MRHTAFNGMTDDPDRSNERLEVLSELRLKTTAVPPSSPSQGKSPTALFARDNRFLSGSDSRAKLAT
jgi:hypothetical protein